MDIFRSRTSNQLFKMIKDDHERIENAFQRIDNASEADREYLFRSLKRELAPHLTAEENAIYPVLKSNLRTHKSALVSIEEHKVAEDLLNKMTETPRNDETWQAKYIVLRGIVTNHIKYEESNVFSEANKAIPEAELNNMVRSFQKEKDRIMSVTTESANR